MSQLIISLSFPGRDNYPEIQKGLIKSIEDHWSGDVWINPDIPYTPHSVMPYQFKYDLIEEAIKQGYKKLWWLDSTMRLNKDISVLLDESEKGLVLFNNEGHKLYKYISDEALMNFPMAIYDLKRIDQVWGGAQGWNFEKPIVREIFTGLKEQILLGSFKDGASGREGFVAARHDQSVLSLLAYAYSIELLPYGVIAAPKDVTDKTYIIYGDAK